MRCSDETKRVRLREKKTTLRTLEEKKLNSVSGGETQHSPERGRQKQSQVANGQVAGFLAIEGSPKPTTEALASVNKKMAGNPTVRS